ncbi:arylsulfatase [Enemella sp. A6]|uniref:arylsulfatase n=1 Tax=Enemella sp. A6 TaxID=3440152 RepID=UPI003EB90351
MTSHEPYAGFGGRIGRNVAESEPWWPEVPGPNGSAPNVVVVIVDDLGYSDIGCYGSEIPTPNLDRIAEEGLQFTNFHVTPMCSPTRAALLTGRNPHAAGIGYVANSDPGFPAQRMELGSDVDTIAERLRNSGYSTFAVGKWHLCKDSDTVPSGAKHSWPLQRGFDRFYGFLGGFTDMFQPGEIVIDNSHVPAPHQSEGYYFTDDITERALGMVRDTKSADPNKPFFLYFAHAAVHAPLQVPLDRVSEHHGRYDRGWDQVRQERYERQIELGVIDEETELAPRNPEPGHDVTAWADLEPAQQQLHARHMESYAAMVRTIDDSVGQLRTGLEELGEWDNTLLVFVSDNGASREGQVNGTSQFLDVIQPVGDAAAAQQKLERDQALKEEMGGPRTLPHYPRGWAMVGNTPFRLYKINTHAGGHTVPALFSWPSRFAGSQPRMRHQYAYVTDLFPTILDAVGLSQDAPEGTKELSGKSLMQTFDDPTHPHPHTEQYYEMRGNRGYYADGWDLVTLHAARAPFDDTEWELYHTEKDRSQIHNLAERMPEKVRELADAWESAAWQNEVFPLDDRTWLERAQARPVPDETMKARLVPGAGWLHPHQARMLVMGESCQINIEFDWAQSAAGVLWAHGGQGGGYCVLVEDGRLRYVHNGYGLMSEHDLGALAEGRHRLMLNVALADSHWCITPELDGESLEPFSGLAPIIGLAPHDGVSIGSDRGSPVSWERREKFGTFPYSLAIHSAELVRNAS